MEIRWIKKDGEKVLQCRFVSTYHEEADKWVDVPVIVEEKTEKEKICNEILSFIGKYKICNFVCAEAQIAFQDVEYFVKQIRDKK